MSQQEHSLLIKLQLRQAQPQMQSYLVVYFYWWLPLRFEVIITPTYLHLTKPERTFCRGLICDGENL